jgi:hypothetical protein
MPDLLKEGLVQIMVEATPAFICQCKIVQNKIVLCTLHKQAETLWPFAATYESLSGTLSWVKPRTRFSLGKSCCLT